MLLAAEGTGSGSTRTFMDETGSEVSIVVFVRGGQKFAAHLIDEEGNRVPIEPDRLRASVPRSKELYAVRQATVQLRRDLGYRLQVEGDARWRIEVKKQPDSR